MEIQKFSHSLVRAYGIIRKAATITGYKFGEVPQDIASVLIVASNDAIEGRLDKCFSRTSCRFGSDMWPMLADDVIATRARKLAKTQGGKKIVLDEVSHANFACSAPGIFSAAIQVAVILDLRRDLLVAGKACRAALSSCVAGLAQGIQDGRAMRAAEAESRRQKLQESLLQLNHSMASLPQPTDAFFGLWLDGDKEDVPMDQAFATAFVGRIAAITGQPFYRIQGGGERLRIVDAFVKTSAVLCLQASNLLNLIDQIKWFETDFRSDAVTPGTTVHEQRTGPNNDLRKSLSSGFEKLSAMCIQVFGNDAALALAGRQGNFLPGFAERIMAHYLFENIALLTEIYQCLSKHGKEEWGDAREVDGPVMQSSAMVPADEPSESTKSSLFLLPRLVPGRSVVEGMPSTLAASK